MHFPQNLKNWDEQIKNLHQIIKTPRLTKNNTKVKVDKEFWFGLLIPQQ